MTTTKSARSNTHHTSTTQAHAAPEKHVAPAAPTSPAVAAALSPPDDDLLHSAYERVANEFGALTPEQIIAINVDVESAVGVVREAAPRILALRTRIAALPEFDMHNVDALEDYAFALWYANRVCTMGQATTTESLPTLHEQVTRVRDELFVHAQALSTRGLMSASALTTMRQGNGYRETAGEVITLVLMYRNAWAAIDGRTVITREDLAAALNLAHRLTDGVNRRDNAPATPTDAIRNRAYAFTLFVRAYEQARRAVDYLCMATGDADAIAPTIYVRTTRSSAAKPTTAVTPATPATPAAPAAPATPTVVHSAVPAILRGDTNVPQDDPFGRT